MSGYRGGHILRLKLINFMTYDDLEIYPDHGLNLIIGLNASGKSSIMCAICLGLGGKAQLTGRSGKSSDFVKYGCEQAIVEIDLENISGQNITVTRIIKGETTTWLMNKKQVSFNEIQNLVKNFNIDVSNLCQFLPQEKVKEFAMMNKRARLENMLQCIGDPYLFNTFKDLKLLKQTSVKLDEEIKSCQKFIEEENQKIERLKIEVDKHEEKLRLIEHLKTFEQLKMYLDYKKIKKHLDETRLEKKNLLKLKENLQTGIPLIKYKIDEKKQQYIGTLELLRAKNRKLKKKQKEIVEKLDEMEGIREMVGNAKVLYENKIIEKKNQLQKLAVLSQQKEEMEQLYSQSLLEKPQLEERDRLISEHLTEIKNDILKLEQNKACLLPKVKQLDQSIRENTVKIKEMEKEENKKMEFLKEQYKDVYDAVLWLKDNHNKFNSQILLPMFFMFDVEDDNHRKFIENCVGQNDLISFVCEDKDDFKLLIHTLKLECKLNVNVVLAPEKSIEEYESPNISNELREMGVEGFMKDLIKAPNPIMCFLCERYKLHLMPFCNSTKRNHLDSLLQTYHSIVTPSYKFVRKQSKYGDQISIRQDHIWESEFIPSSKNNSIRLDSLVKQNQVDQEMLNKFQCKLSELDAEIGEKEREENLQRQEKKTIQTKLKKFDTCERQLNRKLNACETKEKELVDEALEKEIVTKRVLEMCNSVLHKDQIIDQLRTSFMDFSTTMGEKLKCYLKARLIEKKLINLQKMVEEKEKQQNEFEEKLAELKVYSNQLMQNGYEIMAYLVKLVPEDNQTENSEENTDMHIRQKFQQAVPVLQQMFQPYMSYSEFDIEKELHNARAKFEINTEDTTIAFEEFNDRRQRVNDIERKCEAYQAQLKKWEEDMTLKRQEWLPHLEKHIANINSKFSLYYSHIRCAGEIYLDTCNNSDDFCNYGLQVNVKYRDSEPFAELSQAHHSGGECSVAAILFILSLQHLTEVPFRCIDEINQGMDEKNERSIYDLIGLNLKNEYCPQYFLLTPKLLVDLEILEDKNIKVHVIFNSIFGEAKLDVKKQTDLLIQKRNFIA